MSTIHRSRTIVLAFAALIVVGLSAPIAVHAQDQLPPVEDPSVEEQAFAPAPIPGVSVTTQVPGDVRWAPASTLAPTSSVDASRVRAAQHALLSPNLGSLQEEALMAVVATAMAWDETSGYGPVEASRAEAVALLAPAPGPSWDETSGYGAVEVSRAARAASSALPAPAAAPTLRDTSVTTQTVPLFTVTGAGFTAGGRVYLAIYDQMGVQLYETRWITASLPVLAVMGPTGHEAAALNATGGTLRESFANLCGATAMMRAYDEATTTWSNWLTVEPACTAYVEPSDGPR